MLSTLAHYWGQDFMPFTCHPKGMVLSAGSICLFPWSLTSISAWPVCTKLCVHRALGVHVHPQRPFSNFSTIALKRVLSLFYPVFKYLIDFFIYQTQWESLGRNNTLAYMNLNILDMQIRDDLLAVLFFHYLDATALYINSRWCFTELILKQKYSYHIQDYSFGAKCEQATINKQ